MSRAEFGPKVGVHRILDLLDRYEIKATFFVPGHTAERYESVVADMVNRGHEVGHHGYMHEPPATLSDDQQEEVIDKGIRILEGITGQRPVGYRAPSFELTDKTLEILARRDFVYDSSLMAHDAPYFVDTDGGQLVEVPVDWALDDAHYYAFNRGAGAMNTPQDVYKAWEWEFDGVYQYGSAFNLTMHPQHTGRLAKMMVLERFIQYARSHPNVEFMRCIDVAQNWTAEGMTAITPGE
jgi:peptidoglycan/xylan/chitin deacetylase (PgdA/CDA1 family)